LSECIFACDRGAWFGLGRFVSLWPSNRWTTVNTRLFFRNHIPCIEMYLGRGFSLLFKNISQFLRHFAVHSAPRCHVVGTAQIRHCVPPRGRGQIAFESGVGGGDCSLWLIFLHKDKPLSMTLLRSRMVTEALLGTISALFAFLLRVAVWALDPSVSAHCRFARRSTRHGQAKVGFEIRSGSLHSHTKDYRGSKDMEDALITAKTVELCDTSGRDCRKRFCLPCSM